MKRKLAKLFVIITVVATIFAASACNFVSNNATENNSAQEEQQQPYSSVADNSTSYTLKNSLGFSAGISFSDAHTTEYDSFEEVIAETKVNRSVVSIYCKYGSYASMGSGVIIDVNDGVDFDENEDNIFYIITCHHVINDMANYSNVVKVYVPDEDGDNYDDGEYYNEDFIFEGSVGGALSTAKSQAVSLVGGNKESDIAVLRLYVKDDTVASKIVKAKVMSGDNSLELSQSVFAIGNPQGDHAGWISHGNISDTRVIAQVEKVGEMTLIGIDVNTQPGNSGGGLFNMYGELVGITNSGDAFEISGTSVGYGLNCAIPHKISDDAEKDKGFINIAKQLIGTYLSADNNYGYVSGKMRFGFSLSATESEIVVSSVESGSIADEAGLSVNDVIKTIALNDGEAATVGSLDDVSSVISQTKVGDVIKFTVSRKVYGNKTKNYLIELDVFQYYFCDTGDYAGIRVVSE